MLLTVGMECGCDREENEEEDASQDGSGVAVEFEEVCRGVDLHFE